MTMGARQSACIVGYRVDFQRTKSIMQEMLDEAPQADVYFGDGFVTYGALFYAPGVHISVRDKSQTHTVVEMDELNSFVERKNRWYISAFVERAT